MEWYSRSFVQTHMGFTWVPCGYVYFERQNKWAPLWKLLHTLVCPISGNPRVAHEMHTRGSFMGPMEFYYLGGYDESHPTPSHPGEIGARQHSSAEGKYILLRSWWPKCHKKLSRAYINDYILRRTVGYTFYFCHRYMFLAPKSSFDDDSFVKWYQLQSIHPQSHA